MNINRTDISGILIAPYQIQKVLPAVHLIRIQYKKLQDAKAAREGAANEEFETDPAAEAATEEPKAEPMAEESKEEESTTK